MKLILSRKGFDSGNAKMPSPIMPDGMLLSLPIPRGGGYCYSYDELFSKGHPLSGLIKELANLRVLPFEDKAHADPDLDVERFPRKPGWRPIFGQTGGSQSHLENQGVGVGDLFLFFGWFCHTETGRDGRLRYAHSQDGFHAIFGWLQVGQMHRLNGRSAKALPPWAQEHPHVATRDSFDPNNTIYIASDHLQLAGVDSPVPGGGTFTWFRRALRLTQPEGPRSHWALPKWFYPSDGKPPLSYHRNLARWSIKEDHAILRSVVRGQEFVLDTSHYPEAFQWVASLFKTQKGDAE